ncbi:MAG: hypothetical protein ACFCVG_17890 [Kineosporiaceae bacterium]
MTSSRETRARLLDVARRQAGYFTAAQAVDVGYSHQAQWYHRERGHWAVAARGVFRDAAQPPSPHEDLVLAWLWAGDDAVVSHVSAGRVHGLRPVPARPAHVTGGRRRTRSNPDVVLHIGSVGAEDRQDGGGFPVTTPMRTLSDLRPWRPWVFRTWLPQAVDRGLLTREQASALRAGA